MYIQWIPCQEKDVLFLSQKTLENFKTDLKKITLHLGAWRGTLNVRFNEKLDENTIGLSSHLADIYTIHDTLPYDMYLTGEDLHFGPVIAFFVGEGYLSEENRSKWLAYCRNYSEIRGLVYFCTVSGVDIRTKTIRGYFFDPDAEEPEQLKPGIFPFPGVVYRRARMDRDILRELKKHTGGKVFNARIFNKWEMWKVLSEAGFSHTPHTARLKGLDCLEKMLELYNSVYLKPEIGRFGNGILKINKIPDGYVFKGKSGVEQKAENLVQIYKLIKKNKKKRRYIIQQGVPFNFQAKPVDFRVILQKDGSQKWTLSGIIAKTGIKGRIHTNNPSSIDLGCEALQRIFELSPEQALKKENEIIRICTQACLLIERAYGHFGDVGIDVVVDENFNIWVLEINKSHQHDIARYLQKDDPEMYNRVVSRPLEYAKALAGFNLFML